MDPLSIQDLSYQYPGFKSFKLDGISLSFSSGSLTGLLGPNGAGKSTLLKLAAGLFNASRGRVLLNGQPLQDLSAKAISRLVAFVPQNIHFAFPFTGMDVVRLGRFPHRGLFDPETQQDRSACDRALSSCDAQTFADRPFDELSGGEKQRILLASALAQEPRVLLLDEPTTGLDLSHQVSLFKILQHLVSREGLCVVCALHDLHSAGRYFQRLILLKEGRLFASGPPSTVLSPKNLRSLYGIPVKRTKMATGDYHFTAWAGRTR